MDDCRVVLVRARANALLSRPRTRRLTAEATRLNAKADAVLAARAAGESQWGSELPPPVLQQVLELLQWQPAVCGVIRAVCSTWCSILDALLPRLQTRRSAAMMEGKLGWFQSLTELDLWRCENGVTGVLAELGSMPCLRVLWLPASCAESAVDAEALCGLTTLTTLRLKCRERRVRRARGGGGPPVGEWVLDLRLTTLTSLCLINCTAVTDKEVLALSSLTGITDLSLYRLYCRTNVASEGLCAVIK
jgi:hypothetical protein